MRLLVCGDRGWADWDTIARRLDRLGAQNVEVLIQGGATGADALAAKWARTRGIPCLEVPANWTQYGKPAGPIRNKAMLGWKPDLVLAFHNFLPNSTGTANMVKQARLAGVPVEVIRRGDV